MPKRGATLGTRSSLGTAQVSEPVFLCFIYIVEGHCTFATLMNRSFVASDRDYSSTAYRGQAGDVNQWNSMGTRQ